MLCLNGFELYSRWVPLLEVVFTAQLLVIWPKREGCKTIFYLKIVQVWYSSASRTHQYPPIHKFPSISYGYIG